MKRVIACVSDLYNVLDKSNIQLSNKQKDAVVEVLYPHIEHSRMYAYESAKKLCEIESNQRRYLPEGLYSLHIVSIRRWLCARSLQYKRKSSTSSR